MSDSSIYADTEMHLWKIGRELECIRDLLCKFLSQQPRLLDTGVNQEVETDLPLFDSMCTKVRSTRRTGGKHKTYSADVKASVVHSILQCGKTRKQVAEFYGVHRNTLAHWIIDAKKGIK
jgi:hypothetical protein